MRYKLFNCRSVLLAERQGPAKKRKLHPQVAINWFAPLWKITLRTSRLDAEQRSSLSCVEAIEAQEIYLGTRSGFINGPVTYFASSEKYDLSTGDAGKEVTLTVFRETVLERPPRSTRGPIQGQSLLRYCPVRRCCTGCSNKRDARGEDEMSVRMDT